MFGRNQSGNVALLFALMLPALAAAIGGGIEVSRAVEFKQRLTTAADLTCRQGAVYVTSQLGTTLLPQNYGTQLNSIASKNQAERGFGTGTMITAKQFPAPIAGVLPLQPTSINVAATGTLDTIFKSIVSKQTMTFTVSRDCPVTVASTTGVPTLLISESFENVFSASQTNTWDVINDLTPSVCESDICKNKKWTSSNSGIEIDKLPELTGDGIMYGSAFAELDSDCGKANNSTEKTNACKKSDGVYDGQTTNSSIAMTLDLVPATYEIRYVYVARKFETSFKYNGKSYYNYPNDPTICSKSTDTTGAQRDESVAKTAAGDNTKDLDWQTRRIELYVEKKSDGYLFNQKNMVDVCVWSLGWTDRGYKFQVPSNSEYKITWRAAGLDDTRGGLIDYIRICRNSCP